MLLDIQPGDILLLNRNGKENSFFSKAQRFFTGMPFTHVAIILEPFMEDHSVFGAEEQTVVLPLKRFLDEDSDFKIFGIRNEFQNQPRIKQALKELYFDYSGKIYGFLQILWFIYRWGAEKFNVDVRKQKNWFTNGEICSELVWHFFDKIGDVYSTLKIKNDEWNQDTINAGDVNTICQSLPALFKLKYQRYNNVLQKF